MIYRPHLVHESLGAWLAASKNIYLTLCLDVFASAYAPGVSSPQAFGLSPYTLLPFFRQVLESGKVIGFDIAELNPIYDQDSQTAKLAAHFVAEVLKNYVG
jgi:formiminoglutamase